MGEEEGGRQSLQHQEGFIWVVCALEREEEEQCQGRTMCQSSTERKRKEKKKKKEEEEKEIKRRQFIQCNVFSSSSTGGNGLAVVKDDDVDLSEDMMKKFAAWTNLAETAFLLPPTDKNIADYRVR